MLGKEIGGRRNKGYNRSEGDFGFVNFWEGIKEGDAAC